ncbi:PHD finger protein 21A [Armadillidium vulgare]|nr:PHD finger protein 21A [Armadillidium vulgare]
MDLKVYQRQMWFTLKKYLNLISSKRDKINDKEMERECLDILKEIISINENQKVALSALREQKEKSHDEDSDFSPTLESHELFLVNEQPNNKCSEEPVSPPCIDLEAEPDYENEVKSTDSTNELLHDLSYTSINKEVLDSKEEKLKERILLETEEELICEKEKEIVEDIHDLVTSYEFMQALGLLTIQECEEVLLTRKERHKKNALSHVFCQSIWEKQETKRKKRDWLLSSSPPQLRRKVRPISRPPSRQPSRPSSPAEGCSSSPPSSLSPPSPMSPGTYNQNSQNNEDTCSLCKGKGASVQCDGCGVLFHSSCVTASEREKKCDFSEWLCSKCEKMGMRASSYSDPLRNIFSQGHEERNNDRDKLTRHNTY